MKRWVGDEANRRGHAFARKVFEAMQSVGYQARLETKIDSLVDEKLTSDFECKDLRFAKTPNEIAEQLTRFTGQILASGERDDLLKHIDRCNLLKERSQIIAEKIGMQRQDIKLETIVCFSNAVPMQYVKTRLGDVSFMTLQQLESAQF
jgi:hypothetical protein